MAEQVIAYRHEDWRPGEAQIDPDAPSVSEVVEALRDERQNRACDADRARIEGADEEQAEHEQQIARLDALLARLEPHPPR